MSREALKTPCELNDWVCTAIITGHCVCQMDAQEAIQEFQNNS